MSEENRKFINSIKFPILFLFLITVVDFIGFLFDISFVQFGIYPRTIKGLIGIITSPIIHGNLNHLYSNAIPIVVLGTSIFYFYPSSSKKTLTIIYFITNSLVWLFARESYHIGASGIVYGMFSFLFFSGIIRKDKRAITLSVLTIFIYGGIMYGIFPTKEGISWESHLFGFIVGIFTAYYFRKKDLYIQYEWENEELNVDVRDLKISHSHKKDE